jgi:hypothetical protein
MATYKIYEIELELKGLYYSVLNNLGHIFLSKNEFSCLSRRIELCKKLIRIRELQIFVNIDYILNLPLERVKGEFS